MDGGKMKAVAEKKRVAKKTIEQNRNNSFDSIMWQRQFEEAFLKLMHAKQTGVRQTRNTTTTQARSQKIH